jgi:hypothetical protein
MIFQYQTTGWAQIWLLGGEKGVAILNAANLTLQNTWRIVATAAGLPGSARTCSLDSS